MKSSYIKSIIVNTVAIGFSLLMVLSSCEDSYCPLNYGKETELSYYVDPFMIMEINDIFDVFLLKDTIDRIVIKAGENVIDKLTPGVQDSVLLLSSGNSCAFLHPSEKRVRVVIHYTILKTIYINEPAFVKTLKPVTGNFCIAATARMAETDVEVDCHNFLFYTHYNTFGVYRFRGVADNVDLHGYKGTVIRADSLYGRNTSVKHNSTGDFHVTATENLNVSLYNSGNVYYTGDPEVFINELSSSGRLVKVD